MGRRRGHSRRVRRTGPSHHDARRRYDRGTVVERKLIRSHQGRIGRQAGHRAGEQFGVANAVISQLCRGDSKVDDLCGTDRAICQRADIEPAATDRDARDAIRQVVLRHHKGRRRARGEALKRNSITAGRFVANDPRAAHARRNRVGHVGRQGAGEAKRQRLILVSSQRDRARRTCDRDRCRAAEDQVKRRLVIILGHIPRGIRGAAGEPGRGHGGGREGAIRRVVGLNDQIFV